ncbi:YceI family protein [Nocardia sp. NPDC050712]|uniref:YceI family protein n=1 Tax=Nocardia sp. NPDC050712 TaxID=3155518 RepID=UPI0033C9BA2E
MTTSQQTVIAPGSWTLDTAHSAVHFTVKHLGISKIRGRFNHFEAGFVVDNDGAAAIEATVYFDSFDTGNEFRDNHVRGNDMLDVANIPHLSFRVPEPVTITDRFEVTGAATIGGISKPITLQVEWGGVQLFPMDSKNHAGFAATGTISRSDFNVAPGVPTLLLSDAIEIELDIQLIEPSS